MKKTKYALTILFLLIIGIAKVNASTCNFKSGDGTKDNPYKITNAEELKGIECDMKAHYELANDIDLKGLDFEPIGRKPESWYYTYENFEGIFDGKGFSVVNFTMNVTDYHESTLGLFAINKGELKNLNLLNVNISFKADGGVNVGGLVAVNHGRIENVQVTGKIDVEANDYSGSLGGIAGYTGDGSSIMNCKNSANLVYYNKFGGEIPSFKNNSTVFGGGALGQDATGGIVGDSRAATVINCSNKGNITGTRYVGGIIGQGYSPGSEYKNIYNTGNITSKGEGGCASGIVGKEGIVKQAYNTGKIIGLLASGICFDCTITDAYNTGTIEGTELEYGVSEYRISAYGISYSGVLKNVYNIGDVKSENKGWYDDISDGRPCESAYYLKKASFVVPDWVGFPGFTVSQMKDKNNFKGFDFDKVWKMGDESYPFPVLRDVPNEAVFENNIEPGDLNSNGETDLTDVLILLKAFFNNGTVENYPAGDMNENGKIDLADVLILLKEYFKTI